MNHDPQGFAAYGSIILRASACTSRDCEGIREMTATSLERSAAAVLTKSGIAASHSGLCGDQKWNNTAFRPSVKLLKTTGLPPSIGLRDAEKSIVTERIDSSRRSRSMCGANAAACRGPSQNASVMCCLKATLSPFSSAAIACTYSTTASQSSFTPKIAESSSLNASCCLRNSGSIAAMASSSRRSTW